MKSISLALFTFALAASGQNEANEQFRAIKATPKAIPGATGDVFAQTAQDRVRSAGAPAGITVVAQAAVVPSPGKAASGVNVTRAYSSSTSFGLTGGNSSSGIPPVVVRFSGGDDEANASLEEDLTIMTHLIERALQHGIGGDEAVGIKILYNEGGRSVRGMYLDGFGAVFMIKVRFPVFAPSRGEPKEPQQVSDSEWDKAKRELDNEADERGVELTIAGSGTQYDEGKVDELKKVLLQTFKYASNIHNLKPDDFVAVTVFGQPSTTLQVRKTRSKNASLTPTPANPSPPRAEAVPAGNALNYQAADQKARASTLAKEAASLRVAPQGTVLTLRAKKAEVDAFANGKLDFDAFQSKAEQNSYAGSGYGITSINSWSKGGSFGGATGK